MKREHILSMESYQIYIEEDLGEMIVRLNLAGKYSKIIVLTDENTYKDCYPLLKPFLPENHHVIGIFAGEIHKTLSTCEKIWSVLCEVNADRNACLLNLGGGVIGDLGGFVAGVYKRGIDFYQIPTSLLAQVDASVGGKVGIDFMSYKNELGLFYPPYSVLIYPAFLKTLNSREWMSGFAEVVKHHLIADKEGWNRLRLLKPESHEVMLLIQHSINIKHNITTQDPFEKNIRKSLNFGHTIGHAIESYFIGFDAQQVLHGEAVAAGMICESFVSWKTGLLSKQECEEISSYLVKYFNLPTIPTFTHKPIYRIMLHDKKNTFGNIRCVLLNGIGNTVYDRAVSESLFMETMEYYNTLNQG